MKILTALIIISLVSLKLHLVNMLKLSVTKINQ